MALAFDVISTNGFLIFISIILGIIAYYKNAFQYWNRRNVPRYNAKPLFIFGDLTPYIVRPRHFGEHLKASYRLEKAQGYKHTGGYLFTTPKYMPLDLEYIKNVLQRDFNYFEERGFYYNEKDDPLSANLFALGGERWSLLRTKLSPAFTPGKLKLMLNDILKCADQMGKAMNQMYVNGQPVNIKDVAECYTIDVIGSCAFGLECNSFKNPDAEFRKHGHKIFYFSLFRTFTTTIAFSFPKFARWLGIRLFDKESTNFFVNVVKETLMYRKTNNIVRKDFLQLLLELGDTKKESEKTPNFTIEELTAQVFIFFAAGFETSSLTLTYCLYELAINREIQNRVREEINQVLVKHGGKITYDSLMDLKYMNQVLEETLRKYPPVPFITRTCVEDYQVPGTSAVIEKGIDAVISILGVHHDPEYYPDPDNFDPERFSDENKRNRHPFAFIPFGEGPRICIGLRFGLMQTKVGLLNLLKHHEFSLNDRTDLPLKMNPFSFTLIPKSKIILNVNKVEND